MRSAAFLFGLAAAGLFCLGVEAQTSLEYAVKAAYLAKFAPFIEWPESTFSSPTAPLTICVAGRDPFGADLDNAVAGQRDGDHPLAVRRLMAADPADSCQILYVGGTPEEIQAAIEAAKDRPVVTVTESDASAHGVISFVVVDNHVRFDIDEAAADAVGVKFSSKLLDLAHAVKRGARP